MKTNAVFFASFVIASSVYASPPARAEAPLAGHVLTPKFRDVCQKNLDALVEDQLERAEERGSSCLAEVIYDARRARAFKAPIVQACTDKMVAHARGDDAGAGATLKALFDDAYGVIYRSNCLDREVRAFPSHAPAAKSVSSASY